MKQKNKLHQKQKIRCEWANSNELFIPYHDQEWGVPVHDDRLLFEMINLEGAQAGLSWLTILKRRDNYRKAFDQFEAKKIIKYDTAKEASLLQNDGIIRNRLKVHAVVENAKAFLAVKREFGSFDKYIWSFVNGQPILGGKKSDAKPRSEMVSKDLKHRGFKFVGPTICYAYMQAVGMVNDHSSDCFCFAKKFKSGAAPKNIRRK